MIDIKSVIAESLQNLDEGFTWKDIQGKDITVTVKSDKGSQDKSVYVKVGGKEALWSSGLDANDVKELVADFENQAKSVELKESLNTIKKFVKLEDLAVEIGKGGNFSGSSNNFYQFNDKFVTKCRLSQDSGGYLLTRGHLVIAHLELTDVPEKYHKSSKDMNIVLVKSGNTYKMELQPA